MAAHIDLHLHTCFSDGTTSPGELLELVRDAGLSAFSITDHDTLGGYHAVRQILADGDPELVSGVELSVSVEHGDMHILAYLFDPAGDELRDELERFSKKRSERGKLMVDKLNRLGIDITFEDVRAAAGEGVIGRPHVARAMHEKKAVAYYEQAFHKYIGFDGPAYVPKANFTPKKAIDLIHRAGGRAVLAHPGIDDKGGFVGMLVDLGLDGIEVYHPSHTRPDVDRFKHLAGRYRLVVTGGSDFHGVESRYGMVGSQKVPLSHLDNLKALKK
ncbi:MAG: PHP domain-containing protein [Candidatus Zixiibacteriota bacterium]|nr:MAG: PHP domain-containing protein [candidate division Zixibacteria bacterium]